MSYDLAVWEGPRPSSDEEAAEVFDRLMDEMEGSPQQASKTIMDFAAELVTRWPELDQAVGDESPWVVGGQLIEDASGPIIFFGMRLERVEEAVPFIAEVARSRGLVCYDQQEEALK